MLHLRNLSVHYPPNPSPALDSISASFAPGETIGLVGANGAGKSSLMRAIVGLLPFHGEILVDSIPVTHDTLPTIRQKIGFVLQDSDAQMFMPTVLEDLLFGPQMAGTPPEQALTQANSILQQLGIQHLKHRHNHRISGGEKRMAAIATVLAMHPSILLLDEPTSTLDPANRRSIIRTLQSLPQTKLIATHDLDLVLELCPRTLILSNGKLVADGPSPSILSNQALLEAHHLELPLSLAHFPKNTTL